jgi:hypothetical protein
VTRRSRRIALGLSLAAAAVGIAAAKAPLAWEDLTPADWLYDVATRVAEVDGHRVEYRTPTAELARLLEVRDETDAKRYLADARLALGDRPGAVAAIEAWAESEGPQAWADAARWATREGETALAFRAAARALPGLDEDGRATLAAERVAWADAHPDAADPVAMRAERAALAPGDAAAAEDWIRALEHGGRIGEAIDAVEKAKALAPERRLLLRSDLAADHGDASRAFALLDAAVESAEGWPVELKRAYAQRTDGARPDAPDSWRESLERGFDQAALVRLATWFEGKDRGDRAADLLRQVERRYDRRLDADGWRALSRLHAEIDSVPEAFRARLAAAALSNGVGAADDLASLGRLALSAGARPLGWGAYDEEPYRWAAAIDRTPGFWTGGVSFLLTGTEWKDALARLESDSLPDRTFATARALVAELERRAPSHPALPGLLAAILARHVERGEGAKALALLPLVENGPKEAAAEGRRAALLAMRQVEVPLAEETRVWRARLAALAPDGSRPSVRALPRLWTTVAAAEPGSAWTRSLPAPATERYKDVLDEATSRLEQRDPSHRAAADLLLSEMDRLPQAEDLWQELARRLETWNLDDELGPRYERALARFDEPGWWPRAARWYARRSRHRDLDRLASDLAARFRAAAVFARAPVDDGVRLEAPDQPPVGTRVRLVAWADWVRLKALARFPHSPVVFHEAQARLLRRSAMADASERGRGDRVVVDDAVLEERGFAVLFADPVRREQYLADAARTGALAARIATWEEQTARTPVEDLLLFEGRARLSQFEEAVAPAERLAATYPGDADLARRVLSLHRSLAALDPSRAAAGEALVARTAPALADPGPLWTELGELEHEGGHPERARVAWHHLLDRSPRDAGKVEELATVLWDYGETKTALAVIGDARVRLARPRLLAFEAGVLREEARDIDGAVDEYLAAGLPGDDGEDCFCSAFERDQRALRRLSQLTGRSRVRAAIAGRLGRLRPGDEKDERTLVALLPLATIRMPDADVDWTADDWIDRLDHPVDPAARDERRGDRERWRAAAHEGQAEIAARLLARTRAMVEDATSPSFLDAVERWAGPLVAAQPTRKDEVALTAAVMGRRAALAATAEESVTRAIERARYLFDNGRRDDADAAWREIGPRVASLPEGAPRLRAEAQRAAFVERAQGAAAAAAEWERLGARYPWSLGILEDRVAFLERAGRGAEGRTALEQAAGQAAAGHREALLERLAREAIDAQDLSQAQRAVETLLALPSLEDGQRLSAVHLLARLQLRRDAAYDLPALAKREEPRLRPPSRAELHAQLARAAALESRWPPSVAEWIEALNRRLDRGWLREACAAAERGGDEASFVSFFERQRERSPRDVRWAVALREIRLFFGDEGGAVDAARAAIAVRPDRASLWFEAADLLARLGRPREGADLLRDWAKARPGDEAAAGRRSALLAAAGDPEGALAVERQALAAYAAASPKDEEHASSLRDRRGRAARRLQDLGLPAQAWSLLAAGPRGEQLLDSGLGADGEAELALAAGRFLSLLRRRLADEPAAAEAFASVLAERGRPEQKEEVVGFIVGEIRSERTAVGRLGIERLWPFAQQAGLDRPVRIALARDVLARTPGPWSQAAPESFVGAVSATLIGEPPKRLTPPLARLWVRELARRNRGAELWAFLAPRWDALVARVRSTEMVTSRTERLDWAAWLDERDALATWASGAAHDAAGLATLSSLMGERRAWDRLWALAARRWDTGPLVAALPDDARAAWFRLWQQPSPADPRPVVRARGEAVERAQTALGRLTAGRAGAAGDPVIEALRGPRTVGGILDEGGRRADPDLWGERPPPGWLVLETLVRQAERDEDAALVPTEVMDRGGEARRARLASRLAESAGQDALALALAEDVPSPSVADLARRLRLLQSAGRPEDAVAALRDEVRRRQPRMDEATFRSLAAIATDLGLPDALSLLDPGTSVPGPFAAFVCDRRSLAACASLTPIARADFRTALASRYARRPRPLSAEETRYALGELWANEAGPLPSGLRRLGGVWAHASVWLASLRPGDRRAAFDALEALPDDAKLQALLTRTPEPPSESARLLLVRVRLMRSEDEKARALFRDRLAELDTTGGLGFTPVAVSEGGGDEDADTGEVAPPYRAGAADPFAAGLRAWLAPFREAKKTALVAEDARAAVEHRALTHPWSPAAWALALDLATAEPERGRALQQLERAWRLGDLDASVLAPVVEAATRVSPAEGERWLARLGDGTSFDDAATRARIVASLGRGADAASGLARARRAGSWTGIEEVKAFDLWRSLATPAPTPDAPEPWAVARRFWTRAAADPGADLGLHLRAHPLDLRAARAALRTVAPGDPDAMELARRALEPPAAPTLGDTWGDSRVLALRAARALGPAYPAAARAALGAFDPSLAVDLDRRRLPAAEVRGALADVARLSAGAGDAAAAETALAAFEDRAPGDVRALRVEVRKAVPVAPPLPYRVHDGRPEPWRPRDLDWSTVEALLDREGER